MQAVPAGALRPGVPNHKDVRFIGDVMGSYVLASRVLTPGAVQVFACRSRTYSFADVFSYYIAVLDRDLRVVQTWIAGTLAYDGSSKDHV